MKLITYEADGILLDIELPDTAPVIGFASARIKDKDTALAISASAVSARVVRVSSSGVTITPGSWVLQVRAGFDETSARTIYDDVVTVKDSI